MKRIVAALLLGALAFTACGDPYECGPNDRDGDGDGRCNE